MQGAAFAPALASAGRSEGASTLERTSLNPVPLPRAASRPFFISEIAREKTSATNPRAAARAAALQSQNGGISLAQRVPSRRQGSIGRVPRSRAILGDLDRTTPLPGPPA